MIRLPCRVRGASAIGARHPGEQGPFGVRPDEDDDGEDDGEDDGGGLDGEDDQDHDDH